MKSKISLSRNLKILSGAVILASLSLVTAQAADRLDLTEGLLSEVQQIPNGKDNLRVYLSHSLKITRERSQRTRTTEVERDIRREGHDRVLIEKISSDASGMIQGSIHGDTLEVAFDRQCVAKPGPHCTFTFTRLNAQSSEYYLSRVPNNGSYSEPEIRRVNGIGSTEVKRVYSYEDKINVIQGKDQERITLQVVLSEMRDLKVDRRRYHGVD